MTQNADDAQIMNGPSKFDLMLALFDWSTPRRMVTFELIKPRGSEHKLHAECSILDVGAEDGSGESWNIKGSVKGTGQYFKAYFDTRTRKGYVKFSSLYPS